MKYYIMVLNHQGDTLGIFESFENAVAYIEKGSPLPSFYNMKLMPKEGI